MGGFLTLKLINNQITLLSLFSISLKEFPKLKNGRNTSNPLQNSIHELRWGKFSDSGGETCNRNRSFKRYRRGDCPQFGFQRRQFDPQLHFRLFKQTNRRTLFSPYSRIWSDLSGDPSRYGHPHWPSSHRQHSKEPLRPPQNRQVPDRHHNQQRRRLQEPHYPRMYNPRL